MTGNLTFTRKGTAPNPSPQKTATQARLDAICHYPKANELGMKTFVRWVNRINSDPSSYTSAELLARLDEIGPETSSLRKLLSNPPSDWMAETWNSHHCRLLRLEGQMQAIHFCLERRSRMEPRPPLPAGSGFECGSKASISTAAAAQDPFSDE